MTDLLRRAWATLDTFKQAYPENWHEDDEQVLKDLMRADLNAIAEEREACAALLEENAMACENPTYRSLLQANAHAIRARGQA